MRPVFIVGIVCLAVSLDGCGGSTPDAVVQKSISTMDALSDALEKGDKDRAKASAQALKDLDAKMKGMNLTAEQKKAVEEKYKSQMEAAMGRLIKAMFAAVGGGRFTPAELDEIGAQMKK